MGGGGKKKQDFFWAFGSDRIFSRLKSSIQGQNPVASVMSAIEYLYPYSLTSTRARNQASRSRKLSLKEMSHKDKGGGSRTSRHQGQAPANFIQARMRS